MKKKLIFRADGNSKTGLGHLYRLFALVEMFKENYDFVFVTKESSTVQVIPKNYTLDKIPSEISIIEEPNWLSSKYKAPNSILIADGYQFISSYQKEIKQLGFKLMYIDDLATEHMYADLVVNHSPMITKDMFSYENYTKFALGTDYGILRPAFINETKSQRKITKLDKAFVCFGGADPTNLTLKTVKALLEINQIKEINIVVGAAYNDKELSELKTDFESINIYKNLNEFVLVKIMKQSNLAIASSSTILYELCCVKSVILSGYYVDNQERIYNGFIKNNAIKGLGNILNYTVTDFKNAIKNIIVVKDYTIFLNAQQKMFDREIKSRFLNLMEDLC